MNQGVAYQLWCPVHWPQSGQCGIWCVNQRLEFLMASDALRKYWPSWKLRMEARYGRHFFDPVQPVKASEAA